MRTAPSDGEKPIEEVQLGDKVLAKDPDTGEMAYKEVDMLFQREVDETYTVTVGKEQIITTDEHPFWIKDKGWVKSKDLVKGDQLETTDGSNLSIDNIEVKQEHRTVYNFRVQDYHTYYVSNLKLLTHNSNCSNPGLGAKITTTEGMGEVKPFDIVEYGNKNKGLENHHGVMDAWAKNNIPGYVSRAKNSTTMALTEAQHATTKSVFGKWKYENYGFKGKVDWEKVSPQEIQALSERMFDAANVPAPARKEYYSEFMRYIYSLE